MSAAGVAPAWRAASATRVRALIAAALLDDTPEAAHAAGGRTPRGTAADACLGEVTLRPHQREAVARIRASLDATGGALLADAVGLGKTYVALAVAREARAPLVVAPASLRARWADALRRAGLCLPIVTTERLSRAGAPCGPGTAHDLVIVDEAHHFRNPRTRRYDALARLARGARVVLLSATPVHNRRADLDALLALFLGSRGGALDDAARARCIVRRGHGALAVAARPPRALPPRVLRVPARASITERILALPPPLPPIDGGAEGALAVHGLLRLWASSAGALRAGLRRRLARAEALLAALDAGHHLSRGELARWALGGEAVQLAFPELLGACAGDGARAADPGPARAAVRAHRDGVRALLDALADEDDAARAALLRRIRVRHPGERIVAFTQLADTVRAYWGALRGDDGTCALTAREATVAGGRLGRDEALRRFAPLAHAAREPRRAERITLLLSTDVASEGLDLGDASVVVHLDLPWTPARLEQRVGRLTRLGSPHREIAVYALAPPAGLRALLGAERALHAKAATARRAIGAPLAPIGAAPPCPDATGANADRGTEASAPEAAEALRALVARWRAPATRKPDEARDRPLAGAVAVAGAPEPAFLALVEDGGALRLLACVSRPAAAPGPVGLTDDPRLVLRVARLAHAGRDAEPDPATVDRACSTVEAWAAARDASAAVGASGAGTARLQRRVLARLAAIVRDAPLHRRSRIAALAAGARRTLTRPLPAAAERELATLADAPLAPERWLAAVSALGAHSPSRRAAHPDGAPTPAAVPSIVALLLVVTPG